MRARYFYGWNVVAATFVMALYSFGLGFSGIAVYVAALQQRHGWSAAVVSAPVTVYYVAGALLTTAIAGVYERQGPRAVVAGGSVAMAAGVMALGVVEQPWQLYPVFLLMAMGWGATSGAAINIIIAPWFQRRRGLAVSIGFTGATLGGVVVAPALLLLIDAVGFAPTLTTVAPALLGVVLLVAIGLMRRGPGELGLGPDGDPGPPSVSRPATADEPGWRRRALRTRRFWSVSAPFALGLAAQVGVLTHLIALVTPVLGAGGAARAAGATAAAALLGRLATGVVVDRLSPRRVTAATLAVQIAGLVLLGSFSSASVAYAGCILFGLGVGNLTTLPSLVLGAEWPRERFSGLVSLVVGINQLTFAFGPSLVGVVRDATGAYGPALVACVTLQALAAVLVLLGPGKARSPGPAPGSAADPRPSAAGR
jgi:MFS family permease